MEVKFLTMSGVELGIAQVDQVAYDINHDKYVVKPHGSGAPVDVHDVVSAIFDETIEADYYYGVAKSDPIWVSPKIEFTMTKPAAKTQEEWAADFKQLMDVIAGQTAALKHTGHAAAALIQLLYYTGHAPTGANKQLVDRMAAKIPGMMEEVSCPGDCDMLRGTTAAVRLMVIHLNDEHEWTREEIANWLDTLDVDLTVKES